MLLRLCLASLHDCPPARNLGDGQVLHLTHAAEDTHTDSTAQEARPCVQDGKKRRNDDDCVEDCGAVGALLESSVGFRYTYGFQ